MTYYTRTQNTNKDATFVSLDKYLPPGFNRAVSDAQPYLSAALSDIRTHRSGSGLYLGNGPLHVYNETVVNTFYTYEPGIKIFGDGMDGTIIYSHTTGSVFKVQRGYEPGGSAVPLSVGTTFENFTLEGGYVSGSGIWVESTLNTSIKDVRINHFTGSGVVLRPSGNDLGGGGDAGHTVANVDVDNCWITYCSEFAVDGGMAAGVGDIRNIHVSRLYTLYCGGGVRGGGIGWTIERNGINYSTKHPDIWAYKPLTTSTPVNVGTMSGVTYTGVPNRDWYEFVLEITTPGTVGVAVFKWSSNGGTSYTTGVTTAASVVLTGTGITVKFPAGTYTAADTSTTSATGISPAHWKITDNSFEAGTVGCIRFDSMACAEVARNNVAYNTANSGLFWCDLGGQQEGTINSISVKHTRFSIYSGHTTFRAYKVGPYCTTPDLGPDLAPNVGTRYEISGSATANIEAETGWVTKHKAVQQTTLVSAGGTFTPDLAAASSMYFRMNAPGIYFVGSPINSMASAGAAIDVHLVNASAGSAQVKFHGGVAAGAFVTSSLPDIPVGYKAHATFWKDAGSGKFEQSSPWGFVQTSTVQNGQPFNTINNITTLSATETLIASMSIPNNTFTLFNVNVASLNRAKSEVSHWNYSLATYASTSGTLSFSTPSLIGSSVTTGSVRFDTGSLNSIDVYVSGATGHVIDWMINYSKSNRV